jgi:GntR family transcriptional regulator
MQLKQNSSIPLYIQMANYLQRKIDAGVYSTGSKLPSERELSETFNVSRMTARQAVQQLVQRGQAFSKVGKGTFVSPTKIHHELRELTSFTEEMQRRGSRSGSLVLRADKQAADPETTTLLQMPTGEPVIVLQRVRLADNNPLALETAHLNPAYCPDLLINHDFGHESLYRVLREVFHLHLVWANQWIEARLPDTYEQKHLHIQGDDPVLSLTRVTFGENDIPIELVRSVYIGKHYQLRTTLRIGDSPS